MIIQCQQLTNRNIQFMNEAGRSPLNAHILQT